LDSTRSLLLSHRSHLASPADPLELLDPDERLERDKSALEIEAGVDLPGADPETMTLFPFTVPVPLAPVVAGLGTKVVYLHANTNGRVRVRANIRWDTRGRESVNVRDQVMIKAESAS